LEPYSFPHLERDRESFVRVTSQGYVSYQAEEHEVLRRMPSILHGMKKYDIPQSGCCYGRFFARSTVDKRPASVHNGKRISSAKPHVSTLFKFMRVSLCSDIYPHCGIIKKYQSSLEFASSDEFL
jgi:hypothetical protein